jgi:stage V sporulation protein K
MANKKIVWLLTFFDEKPDLMQSLEPQFEDVVQVCRTSFVVSTQAGIDAKNIKEDLKKRTGYEFLIGSLKDGTGPSSAVDAINDISESKTRKLIQITWKQASGSATRVWEEYTKPSEQQKVEVADHVDAEISELIAVKEFKQTLLEIEANIKRSALLDVKSDKAKRKSYHTLMIGNPGTCKTTAARLYARKLKQLGILSGGHLVETDRSGLVAGHVGQTEEKTMQMLKSAVGGVLYIDEAYSLYSDSERDYGHVSIATINKFMEDHRGEIVVVMAGYPREMQNLLEMNSGLPSRFPIRMNFPDYSKPELLQIAKIMFDEENLISCQDFEPVFSAMVDMVKGKNSSSFGNGRFVRDTVEALGRQLSLRLHSAGMLEQKYQGAEADILKTITSADIWAVAERVCGLKPSEVVGATKPLEGPSHLRLVPEARPDKIS